MRRLIPLLLALAAAPATAQPRQGEDPLVWVEHEPPGEHPILGPRQAPVTIDFFANLGDGTRTATLHGYLVELAARHPTRLRVVYHLTNRFDRSSDYLQFGREAFEQGRFFEFLEAYYGPRRRHPRRREFDQVAAQAGLDVERTRRAIDERRHEDQLRANFYQRYRLGARVPGLVVNGEPIDVDVRSVDQLEDLYDRAYARARVLLDAGVPVAEIHPGSLREAGRRLGARAITPGAVDGLAPGEQPPAPGERVVLGPLARAGHARGGEAPEAVFHFFCHFTSRHCRETARALRAAERAYPDELRLVFHPLYQPAGEDDGDDDAARMAEAAACAGEQDAFWELYDRAFARGRRRDIEASYLVDLAEAIAEERAAFEVAAFERCLESGRQAAAVEAAREAAHRQGLRATPTLVSGGRAYVGALDFEDLRTLVERERSPGLLERFTAQPRPGGAASHDR